MSNNTTPSATAPNTSTSMGGVHTWTPPELTEVQHIETIASPVDAVLKARPEVVVIDKCAYRLDDIQCILFINTEEHDYEIFFVGGHSVYVDDDTAETLMELL